MGSTEFKKVLENVEWATVNVAIREKYNCLLIPDEKWTSVTDALYERLDEGEEWLDEWDY